MSTTVDSVALDASILREASTARDRVVERQVEVERARADYHAAIRRLNAEGGSTREIADALGLSHQRVHQIVFKERSSDERVGPLVRLVTRRGRSRLSAEARRVVVGAEEEAAGLGDPYVGPEHLLLALLAGPENAAAKALASLGVTTKAVRAEVQSRERRGMRAARGSRGRFTPEAKKVLELSVHEALELEDDSIRPEHLLLALLRAREKVAGEILEGLGIGEEAVRRTVLALREA
jgi:hypothetical protein